MQKYEYHIQTVSYVADQDLSQDESVLNHWGKEGWELVAVSGPTEVSPHGVAMIYFFRRPI